jgi:hypothetical protein
MPMPDKPCKFDEFRCCICGTEITRQQASLLHTCSSWKCRCEYHSQLSDQARQFKARLEQKHREFREKLNTLRDQAASDHGIADPKKFLPICVPDCQTELVPVSSARRERLRENLTALIDEAHSGDVANKEDASDSRDQSNNAVATDCGSQSSDLPVFLAAACSTCGGASCQGGAEHAHLNAKKMHDYIAAHPEAESDDIVEICMRQVPAMAHQDSCIFHAANGCPLPRERRADLCNGFECNGLLSIREEVSENENVGLFIVASVDEQISRHRIAESET